MGVCPTECKQCTHLARNKQSPRLQQMVDCNLQWYERLSKAEACMLSVCAAGPRASTVLSFLQHITMVLITIGYHIAAAQSMNYIAKEICRVR